MWDDTESFELWDLQRAVFACQVTPTLSLLLSVGRVDPGGGLVDLST